ncbi:MAG: hypothetical protein V2J14_11015, partial [Erythrobacter sp.]|nr:hypothetical protein [Erythrobacter sp.]
LVVGTALGQFEFVGHARSPVGRGLIIPTGRNAECCINGAEEDDFFAKLKNVIFQFWVIHRVGREVVPTRL